MASKPYKNPFLVLVFLVAFCSRVLPCSEKNMELHKKLEYLDTWQKADDAPLNMTPGPIGMLKFYPDGFFQVAEYVKYFGGEYYGIEAEISVYGLPIAPNAASIAYMSVSNFDTRETNYSAIYVGWHIDPRRYGDYDTHFFVYWEDNGFEQKGCFNLNCPGFVLHSAAKYIPAAKIWPLSKYGGDQKYVDFKLYKDSDWGNWWLYEGVENFQNPVGYFKKEIFTNFRAATQMKLGGKVVYPENSRASPMGSGHMYYEGDKKAAKFDHIKFIDNKGYAFAPDKSWVSGYASAKCYGLSDFTYHDFGASFYYGGPGGC